MHSRFSRPSSAHERGSVLVVALLLTTIIGISLASYVRLGQNALEVSSRSFYSNAAINLAETGLEHAMWSINRSINPDPTISAAAWSGWKTDSDGAWQKWSDWDLGANIAANVRVHVENHVGSVAPTIRARATITLPRAAPVEKWIEVKLRKRSKFANGLVAKETITFRGAVAKVDSWNSDPDNDPGTAAVDYAAATRRDNGSVGSISVAVDAVLVKNADIWGYAATGKLDPVVGANGSVLGAESAAKNKTGWADPDVDPDRISTDFAANFDPVIAPTNTYVALGGISGSLTLPRGTDTPAADGKYYYSSTGIALSGNTRAVSISADKTVVLVVNGDVSATGKDSGFYITNTGKLEMYVSGNVDLKGNGVVNGTIPSGSETLDADDAQAPINFQLWGTGGSAQSIDIGGTAAFSGVIYAPDATVNLHGNVDALGSIVARTIDVKGSVLFHYDESLGDMDTGNPYGITRWWELTNASDRTEQEAKLNF